jgi:hypothetical protein
MSGAGSSLDRVLALGIALWTSACTIVGLPPIDVAGTVRAPDGRPIEGATVALHTSFVAPLCCDWSGVLQLTRTGPDGRYRFVAGADHDFQFAGEARSYHVVAVHARYVGDSAWPIDLPLSAPLDLTLEPKNPDRDSMDGDCLALCGGLAFEQCRLVAEFHFGDKTRCDQWRENFW